MIGHSARRAALVGCAALSAIVVSCSTEGPDQITTPAALRAFPRATRALTAPEEQRIASARARTRWVGASHHVAMQVVIAAIHEHGTAARRVLRPGSAQYCEILNNAGAAALHVIDQAAGGIPDRAQRLARARRDPALSSCAATLSVFGAAMPAPARTAQEADPEVTGAYEQYLDPMSYAVTTSDGSVSGVTTAVQNVLAQSVIDGVPEGDLLALAAFAGLIESSAAEWNAYPWPSTGSGSGSSSGEYALSVFSVREMDDRVLKVVGADAIGCLSTVKGWGALKALLVGPAWAALAAECGLRAAFASGGAVLGML